MSQPTIDQAKAEAFSDKLVGILNSGALALMISVGHRTGLFDTVSCMHCMTVSLALDGEGLGAMWGEVKTLEYRRDAVFPANEVKKLAHDFQNNYYVSRKE